jgi:2-deoxy-D-gluconate 3-dehydrogenase
MDHMFSLEGRTALVTGCRRGIGRAIAIALARAGADILGVSRQLEPDSDVEQAVIAAGRRFARYQVDLANRAAVKHLLDETHKISIDS